jgi:outer membrane protein assembly factor BamB
MLRGAALCLLLVASCSSGGSDGTTSVPTLDWATFRHDSANSGFGRGSIENNSGTAELLVADLGGVTSSTPVIGRDKRIYLGTGDGLLSVDENGNTRWRFDVCDPTADGDCSDGTCVEVGPVSSSAAVTPGDDVVVASDGTDGNGGRIFHLFDDGDGFTCEWSFPAGGVVAGLGTRSSPITLIDANDLSLISAFVGTREGNLLALNGDGTEKWRFPDASSGLGDLTSSPVLDATGTLFVAAPDGFLYALDLAGRSLWKFQVGVTGEIDGFLPSPAQATAVYLIGPQNTVLAVNPDGTLKWRRQTLAPVLGSPSVAGDIVRELKCSDSNAPCSSDADCPLETCSDGLCSQSGNSCSTSADCPTEECRSVNVFDTAVDIVDADGTLYGIRDTNGELATFQRCSGSNSNSDCDDDGDCPEGGVCEERTALFPMWSGGSVSVTSSPAISNDFFVIVGTAEGLVCARRLDGTVPDDAAWESGCVPVGDGTAVRSSPIVDSNGRIYVTTDQGLWVIQ